MRGYGRRVSRRLLLVLLGVCLAAALASLLAVIFMREPPLSDHPVVSAGHALDPVQFAALPGWPTDRPAGALDAFRRSCGALAETAPRAFRTACRGALELSESAGDGEARAFFEAYFRAFRVRPTEGSGLLTAYYEPVIEGSRERSRRFPVPLYALPADYVEIMEDNRPGGFPAGLSSARRTPDGLRPWPTRREIDDGGLDGLAVPLAWVADPVDAFFIHIQGSARIALGDGGTMRMGFAGRNGHPYTSVASVMMARGIRPEGGYSMDGLRGYFRDNPRTGRALMHENKSYIFFREIAELAEELGPIGAQGVPLTSGRSLAVDPAFHRLGTPIFIDARLPTGPDFAEQPFQRLMIAQDTGAAIKGPARGDIFWGTGREAGSAAGGVKVSGSFYVLLPRS